ncbi:MAG: glycoside hydrolase [Planctomycetota bacterium]
MLQTLFSSHAAEPVTITIDASSRSQTIHGFGASGAWWPNWFDRLETADQERALDLLFTDIGADLTIFRWNIPSASADDVTNWRRRTADIETAPFDYDLSRAAKSMDVLRRVVERDVSRVTLFANSPPRRLTRNGKTSGGDAGGSNLAVGAEADFARYLVDVSELVMAEVGLDEAWLSPINEPQWKWGEDDRRRWQEGCRYTPGESAAIGLAVVDEIASRERDDAPTLHLEMFDSGSWASTQPYAEAIWNEPRLASALDEIAIHSYWSDVAAKRDVRAWLDEHLPGVPVAMTEYCQMEGGHDPGMDSGLHVARVIHEDLTIGRVTSWVWWLGLSSSRFKDGLIHAFLPRGGGAPAGIEDTKRLWVLAQWSRLVRPGSVRVEAAAGGSAVMASAFETPSGDLVCVVVNPSADDIQAAWQNDDGERLSVRSAWVTDADNNMERFESLDVLPPQSVVSVVLAESDSISSIQPNFLWITCEDMDPDIGAYGNDTAHTPHLDALAERSIVFERAFATSPVCSPSRTAVFFGQYQTSLGLGNHRAKRPTPPDLQGWAASLRDAGYFVTNHTKTDFNSTRERELVRRAFDRGRDWRDRPSEDTPFFSIINSATTHASRTTVWPRSRFEREVGSKLPRELRQDPAGVPVLSYQADTPEARSDIARYYDGITALDMEVGKILQRLEDDGLADSTIVFFFSDHGAGLPRHKGTALETGLRVPLLVYVPEAFRELTGAAGHEHVEWPVSQVDFGPTLLSLAGLGVPDEMHGVSLFPKLARQGRPTFVYGARDRCDERFDCQRSVTDGRFVYLRNFWPQVPHSQPHHYQRESVIRLETAQAVRDGSLRGIARELTEERATEELYDLQNDPDQLVNLAEHPDYRGDRDRLRSAMQAQLKHRGDLNLIPEPELLRIVESRGISVPEIADLAHELSLEDVYSTAMLCGFGWQVLPSQLAATDHDQASVRFWVAMGLYHQDAEHQPVIDALHALAADESPVVRAAAAWSLVEGGHREAGEAAFRSVLEGSDVLAAEFAARAIQLLGAAGRSLHTDVVSSQARLESGRMLRIISMLE